MTALPASIIFENVTVRFGQKLVFEDFCLQVLPGEKICLSGPSGVGKTTLLNLVMGFTHPVQGNVEVLGRQVAPNHIRWIRSRLAWVPQDIMVAAETAGEFLMLPFHFKNNRPQKPPLTEVNAMLESLGLEKDILAQSMTSLSGGQKQRIAIAAAILLKKPILLLDEPTSALDKESAAKVADAVRSLQTLSVLSVSHDEEWALAMDRKIPVQTSPYMS